MKKCMHGLTLRGPACVGYVGVSSSITNARDHHFHSSATVICCLGVVMSPAVRPFKNLAIYQF